MVSEKTRIATECEGLEAGFTVSFRSKKLGFALTKKKRNL